LIGKVGLVGEVWLVGSNPSGPSFLARDIVIAQRYYRKSSWQVRR
jgi:hypothetical protein